MKYITYTIRECDNACVLVFVCVLINGTLTVLNYAYPYNTIGSMPFQNTADMTPSVMKSEFIDEYQLL